MYNWQNEKYKFSKRKVQKIAFTHFSKDVQTLFYF